MEVSKTIRNPCQGGSDELVVYDGPSNDMITIKRLDGGSVDLGLEAVPALIAILQSFSTIRSAERGEHE